MNYNKQRLEGDGKFTQNLGDIEEDEDDREDGEGVDTSMM